MVCGLAPTETPECTLCDMLRFRNYEPGALSSAAGADHTRVMSALLCLSAELIALRHVTQCTLGNPALVARKGSPRAVEDGRKFPDLWAVANK